MGSMVEINDTLQLTRQQGFPAELDLERHQKQPFQAEEFAGRVFEFGHKDKIRVYHAPPVRNFLVENKDGKWIYWGLVHITEIRHDYVKKETSGKFEIIYLNTPEEMKIAHRLVDRNSQTAFWGNG